MITDERITAVREMTGELSSSVARSIFIGHSALIPGSARADYQAIWDCAVEAMHVLIADTFAEVGGDDPITVRFTQEVATGDVLEEYRRLCIDGGVHLRNPATVQ